MSAQDNTSADDKKLDDWLESLAGKQSSDTQSATAQQAARIREQVLSRQVAAEDSVDSERLAQKRDELLARVESEGLLKERRETSWTDAFSWLLQPQAAAAAGVAVMAVAVFLVTSNLQQTRVPTERELLWSIGEIDAMRGAAEVISIATADPDSVSRELAGRLADAGVPFELLGATDASERLLRVQIAGQAVPEDIARELEEYAGALTDYQVLELSFVER